MDFRFVVLENIVIIICITIGFIMTKSPWIFLLLILMNSFKYKSPNSSEKKAPNVNNVGS